MSEGNRVMINTLLLRRSAKLFYVPVIVAVLAGVFGLTYAEANVRVTLKAPQQIKLGQGAKLKVKVNGVTSAQLKAATYQVEVAAFPYKLWKSTGPGHPVRRRNFDIQVKPRSNAKFRVAVELEGDVSRSKDTLVYVDGNERAPLNFKSGGRVTVGFSGTYDAAFADKWSGVPRKDKYLYVFEACGNAARPTTNYRFMTKVTLRLKASGQTTAINARRHLRTRCPSRFPSFWIVTYFSAFPNPPLKNGDDGFGKPKVNRKHLMLNQRLKMRKTLTVRQTKSLIRAY